MVLGMHGKPWPTAYEETMTMAVAEKISFIELAKRVLEKVGKPMNAGEIWQYAEQTGIAPLLQSTGKTPEASLGSRLYTDVQKPTSALVQRSSCLNRLLALSLICSSRWRRSPHSW